MIIHYRHYFDAAHRLAGYDGLCAHVHGHRYVVEFKFEVACVNELGISVDFNDIKNVVGSWIDRDWDHTLLVNALDQSLSVLNGAQRIKRLNGNPTAENIAVEMAMGVSKLIADWPVTLKSVIVWETPDFGVEIEA